MDQTCQTQPELGQTSVEVQVGGKKETRASAAQTKRARTASSESQTDEPPELSTKDKEVQASLKSELETEHVAMMDIEIKEPTRKPAKAEFSTVLTPGDQCADQDCSSQPTAWLQQMEAQQAVSIPQVLNMAKAMHLKQQLDQLQHQGQDHAGHRHGAAAATTVHGSSEATGEAAERRPSLSTYT